MKTDPEIFKPIKENRLSAPFLLKGGSANRGKRFKFTKSIHHGHFLVASGACFAEIASGWLLNQRLVVGVKCGRHFVYCSRWRRSPHGTHCTAEQGRRRMWDLARKSASTSEPLQDQVSVAARSSESQNRASCRDTMVSHAGLNKA